MKSILLFRLGGLGDLLVALPAIHLLRRAFSKASVGLVGRKDYGELLRGSGAVDEVFSADDAAWTPLFEESDRIPKDLRARLSSYDLVLGWFQGRSRLPLLFSGSRFVSPERSRSFHYDADSELSVSRFFFDRTAEFLRALDASIAPFEACCHLSLPADEAAAGAPSFVWGSDSAAMARPLTVLHPGSGSPAKCWPLDRFLTVTKTLRTRGGHGVLVTGEAEERMEAELRAFVFPPKWRWLPRPSLMDLARRLGSGVLYLGNDSGVTHLAAARGAEVVAIFRKELEMAWAPFGRTCVISADEVAEISVERVLNALRQSLGRLRAPTAR